MHFYSPNSKIKFNNLQNICKSILGKVFKVKTHYFKINNLLY